LKFKNNIEVRTFSNDAFNELLQLENDKSSEEIIQSLNKILGNRLILLNRTDSGSFKLFRTTTLFSDFKEDDLKCYSHPPKEKTLEPGRAHIKGYPVFYCAQDEITAILEQKDKINSENEFYLSEWELQNQPEVVYHNLVLNSETIKTGNPLKSIAEKDRDELKRLVKTNSKQDIKDTLLNEIIDGFKLLGDFFTMKGNQKYHITGSYGHYILYESKNQNQKIDGLLFPSIENDHQTFNIAFHPDIVGSSQLKLSKIFKVKSSRWIEDKTDLNLEICKIGEVINDEIIWKQPNKRIIQMHLKDSVIISQDDEVFNKINFTSGNSEMELIFNGFLRRKIEIEILNNPNDHQLIIDSENFNLGTTFNSDRITIEFKNGESISLNNTPVLLKKWEITVDWEYFFV
jgi:hypothetical protein